MDKHVERNHKDKDIVLRLAKYLKPHTKMFVVSFILMILVVLIDLVGPLLMGMMVELLSGVTIELSSIFWIVGAYLAFIAAIIVVNYFQAIILNKIGQKILYKLREDVFMKIEGFSLSQINSRPVGKLVTRVTTDTNSLNELFTDVLINIIKNVITIVLVLIVMFVISVKLTLFVLIVTPFLVAASFIFRAKSRKTYRSVRTGLTDVNTFLSENISGIKITQVFNQNEKKVRDFTNKNSFLRKSHIKEMFVFAFFRPFIYILYLTTVTLILFFGGKEAVAGTLSAALLVAYYNYINTFYQPIQQFADQYNRLQSAFASSEKIFDIMDVKPEIVDVEHPVILDNLKGKIEFRNVWFAYEEEEWILRDVSFVINPGNTVAFVGATGAGKTTILGLIVRNYDIQKGNIYIDDVDIKDVELSSLKKQVGQMLQDVFLFSGDIMSNITLKEEQFTLDEVKEACKYVNANYFIEKLPDKYRTEVLERGNNFSSGQRQLLSFARTIIHKPKIMILDEATANIDTETEILIQDSLEKMMNIGTMLIVAHRLSTIQHADKIIVLHKGKIVESGTHQDLLRKEGLYYKLYQLQYNKH